MTLEEKIRKAIPELGNDKPIQLNHVLEYLGLFENINIRFTTDRTMLAIWNEKGSVYFDLKSNLLSDQSDELKNFIDELA